MMKKLFLIFLALLSLNLLLSAQELLLKRTDISGVYGKKLDGGNFEGNFYRADDVSATAYFYLNKPTNTLPVLGDVSNRINGLKEKVWDIKKSEK